MNTFRPDVVTFKQNHEMVSTGHCIKQPLRFGQNRGTFLIQGHMFPLTVVWKASLPGVDQCTHSPGGGGAHEDLTSQLCISGHAHGIEGGIERKLLARQFAPVDLIIDFLKA